MPKASLSTLTLGLIVAASSLALPAQVSADLDMKANLYLTLSKILLGTAKEPKNMLGEKGTAPDATLVLACPGFPIPEGGLNTSDPADMVFINQTLDIVPGLNAYYVSSGKRYSDIYGHILNSAKVTPANYGDGEPAELKGLIAKLDPTTDLMVKYYDLETSYSTAVDARNQALANKKAMEEAHRAKLNLDQPVPLVSSALDRAVNKVLAPYTAMKGQIAPDVARLRYLINKGSDLWWNGLVDRFNNQITADSDVKPLAVTFPKPEDWAAKSTWTTFSWKASSKANSSEFSQKQLEAAMSYSAGPVSLSISGGFDNKDQSAAAQDDSTEISVDLMRVAVYRPWMDYQVFQDTHWDYQGDPNVPHSGIISDGRPPMPTDGSLPNTGVMPWIIDQVWLAKNLVVSGKWVAKYASAMDHKAHAEASGGYGPFSFSASYSQQDKKNKDGKTDTEQTIKAEGIQVIGFTCTTVPRSPTFAGDATSTKNPENRPKHPSRPSIPAVPGALTHAVTQ
jgi:hypothetical protein